MGIGQSRHLFIIFDCVSGSLCERRPNGFVGQSDWRRFWRFFFSARGPCLLHCSSEAATEPTIARHRDASFTLSTLTCMEVIAGIESSFPLTGIRLSTKVSLALQGPERGLRVRGMMRPGPR